MSGAADDTEEPSDPRLPSTNGPRTKKSFGFLESDQFKGVKSPLIAPFLKDHIDRIEDEIAELKPYLRLYYETKANLDAVHNTKKLSRFTSALSSIMLTIGGMGFGIAKDLWSLEPYGKVIGFASIMLVCGSFFVRVKDA